MKKNADNKADLLSKKIKINFIFLKFKAKKIFLILFADNIDASYLESLQSLRSELSSKHFKKQLDAFGLYV